MKPPGEDHRLGRRELLQRGALEGLGMSMLPLQASAQPVGPRVRRYATLGRTGLRVSDISFGGSRLGAGEGDVVRHALDRGINYFDTAASYQGGESATVIGGALRGKRDRVHSGMCTTMAMRGVRTYGADQNEELRALANTQVIV